MKSEDMYWDEFLYLNRLRERGTTNMFGAAPFLAATHDVSDRQARQILAAWMEWVRKNPANRDL